MKKKILFFITSLDCGGAEHALINAAKFLPRERYEITVVSLYGGSFEKDVPSYVKYSKILKTERGFFGRFSSAVLFKVMPKRLFCSLFLKGHYDTAVAFLEGFPTRVIAKFNNANKKVAFVHCTVTGGTIDLLGYNSLDTLKKDYGSFDKICVVSEAAKQSFLDTVGNGYDLSVVHNFLDVDEISKKSLVSTEKVFSKNSVKIISVGSLSAVKGYDRLIPIIADVQKRYNVELVIVGDGPQRSLLSEKIEKTGAKIKLIGQKDNPYSYLKQADFFLCSSRSEGYSTAVIEALIMNLPVLTTDCNGMREILDNGRYGMIVGCDDDSLKNGIEKMLTDNCYLSYKETVAGLNKKIFIDNALMGYSKLFDD